MPAAEAGCGDWPASRMTRNTSSVAQQVEDGEPVEHLAAGDAHADIAPPRGLAGAGGAFPGAHAHGVDEAAAEAAIGLEPAAQFACDRAGLEIRRSPPGRGRGPHAALLDALQQGLPGSDGREDQRHVLGQGGPNMVDCATSRSGAWTATSRSRGTRRDSRIVIACESSPPEVEIATAAPRRMVARHLGGRVRSGKDRRRISALAVSAMT